MEIKKISGIFENSDDIRPVGKSLEDHEGKYIYCPDCKKGILFVEFESNRIKCTQCGHVE